MEKIQTLKIWVIKKQKMGENSVKIGEAEKKIQGIRFEKQDGRFGCIRNQKIKLIQTKNEKLPSRGD